jgi:cytochrome c nitrite reductase small subunit
VDGAGAPGKLGGYSPQGKAGALRARGAAPNLQAVPYRLLTVVVLLGAVFAGVALFTFRYAYGLSYFSTDPRACANCHIMNTQYESWQHSSHHGVATCADCHLPHDFIGKYIAKAENGYHHSKGFTLQDFHEPIVIKAKNSRILQQSCLHCHEDVVHDLLDESRASEGTPTCVRCHAAVGHGPRTGIGGRDRGIDEELAAAGDGIPAAPGKGERP